MRWSRLVEFTQILAAGASGSLVSSLTVLLFALLLTWLVLKILGSLLTGAIIFIGVLVSLYYIVQWRGEGLGNLLTIAYQLISFFLIVLGGYVTAILERAR